MMTAEVTENESKRIDLEGGNETTTDDNGDDS